MASCRTAGSASTVSGGAPMAVAITGRAHGRRLDGGPAEGLGLGRGDDRHMRGEVGGGHVLDMADEADVASRPACATWVCSDCR